GDVGAPDARIVRGHGLVDDLAGGAGDQIDDLLGDLEDGDFRWISEVDRLVEVVLHRGVDATNQIGHVTQAAGLSAVAEDGDRLVVERLADKADDYTAVVWVHARAVRVENSDKSGIRAALAVIG